VWPNIEKRPGGLTALKTATRARKSPVVCVMKCKDTAVGKFGAPHLNVVCDINIIVNGIDKY